MKQIRKQKKGKGKEQKKGKGRREPFGPAPKSARGPASPPPKRVRRLPPFPRGHALTACQARLQARAGAPPEHDTIARRPIPIPP
jgi:hypothetical protein